MDGVTGPKGYGAAEFSSELANRSTHTVRQGETSLAEVAKRLGLPFDSLQQANPQIGPAATLKAGQEIHLPQLPVADAKARPSTSETALQDQFPAQVAGGGDRELGAAFARARLTNSAEAGGNTAAAGTARAMRSPAGPVTAGSTFVGMRLGTNTHGEEVRVKREVGSPKGYDDRLQAIAVARLAGAEPAAVVQDTGGRWHALETTAGFSGGLTSAAETPTLAAYGLPSSVHIAKVQAQVNSLKQKLADSNHPMTKSQREDAGEELTRASKHLASLIFGVPESEIQFNRSSGDRQPGKINITGRPEPGAPAGAHGPASGHLGEEFRPGLPTAFEIRLDQLLNPASAQGTLFHEVSHLKDHDLAQQWVKKYEQETKRTFVSGAPGRQAFEGWMRAQAPARLSKADAEVVMDLAGNFNATTEARANARAFLTALQAGAAEVAVKGLAAYAKEMKPGGHYATPANGSAVVAELTKELRTAYGEMPKDMQRQFDAAVAAARKENPNAWVSSLKFSK
ncbi:MAG TPA: LysM domain-containing protein [Bryobacteraceae bacterium]|nr:LysM domain-containing protein [Bryobacteraceae bacterium]